MASRLNGTNAYFSRTSNLVNTASGGRYTIMLWMYHLSVTGFRNIVFAGIDDSTTQTLQIDAGTLQAWVNVSGTNGSAISTNTWYHVAIVKDGDSTNNYKIYLNGALDIQMTVQNFTATKLTIGAWNAGADFASARYCIVKVWSTNLTAAEIAQEQYVIRPVKAGNLLGFYPMFPNSGERVIDYSGNGYNWTENGTVTDEDPPPVSWGSGAYFMPYVAPSSGGTTYPLIVGGTLTPSGSLTKQGNKVMSGALTPSGGLLKLSTKIMVGNLTPSGGLLKLPTKVMTGSLTPSGSLTKQPQKNVAGNLTSSGGLSKQISKLLAGALTSSGRLIKTPSKLMAGSLTSSGAIVSLKTAILIVAGALGMSGSLIKQPLKAVSGTVTTAGSLNKTIFKTLVGSLTSSGALVRSRLVSLVVSGTLTPSGRLVKQPQKVVSGSLTPTGGLAKQIRKFFSGALSFIGSFVGNSSAPITIGAGIDIADKQHYPIVYSGITSPLFYDTHRNGVYYQQQSDPSTILDGRRSPMIYGD